MSADELIKRYIHEVGSHLPKAGREDIQRELESLIRDSVDERAGEKEPSEKLVSEILMEFGRPEKMAAEYRGERQLIGPTLFPIYKTVVSIVLSVLTGLHVLAFAVTFWGGRGDLTVVPFTLNLGGGGSLLTSLFQSLLMAFGSVTLIFGGIEWYYGSDVETSEDDEDWDPATLPPLNDPDRIKRGELITGIVVSIVFTGIGLAMVAESGLFGWTVTDGFRAWIPLWVASVAADVLLKALLVWYGRWNPPLRWFDIAKDFYGIYVAYRVISLEVITTVAPIETFIRFGLRISIVLFTIAILFKIGRELWRWRFGTSWSWQQVPIFSSKGS